MRTRLPIFLHLNNPYSISTLSMGPSPGGNAKVPRFRLENDKPASSPQDDPNMIKMLSIEKAAGLCALQGEAFGSATANAG